jgi:glutamate formiminotransferase / 5-formyltetrahydrofolate cyclo-ligase
MDRLIECVPNVSEGHDRRTLDAIARVLAGHRGAWLLDRSSDPDHERSVYTLAGRPDSVTAAMGDAVGEAIDAIDMRSHRGQHPRIGAVDVIPFIPLGSSTMGQCVQITRDFAADIAERYSLPVFLYGMAAQRDDRRSLVGIRRGGFEGLGAAMHEPGGVPDLGPPGPHPSAGAVAVGARPFLIAFNIQLATPDVAIARRMAARIRERDGGLAGVQALGLMLASEGHAQLSLNILDHERTPLWRVWEEAERLARIEHVALLDSELVGLAPMGALLDVADHIGVTASDPVEHRLSQAGAALCIRLFEPSMALELRLDRLRQV